MQVASDLLLPTGQGKLMESASSDPFRRLLACQLIKKFPALFGNQKFISSVHKGPPPNPTLNYKNPTYASSPLSFTAHFNIIFRVRTALFWVTTRK